MNIAIISIFGVTCAHGKRTRSSLLHGGIGLQGRVTLHLLWLLPLPRVLTLAVHVTHIMASLINIAAVLVVMALPAFSAFIMLVTKPFLVHVAHVPATPMMAVQNPTAA